MVYKVEDVFYDCYDNSWDFDNEFVKWMLFLLK